ncbi:MAG: hypothetical protein GY755_21025 [Chloroflexi bacterium]|nr:hypothetical protein [Chloroflexota bacterium]
MDSLDLLPLLCGYLDAKGHEIILQLQQAKNDQNPSGPYYAIRRKEWKLILLAPDKKNVKDLKPIALFDLKNNPFEDEKYNQINNEQYVSLVSELLDEYLEIRETDKATVSNN